MKRRRSERRLPKLFLRWILLLLTLTVTGCGGGASDTSAPTGQDDRIRIGVSFPTTELNYRSTMLELLEEYAKEHEDTIEFVIRDARSSQEKQNQDLLEMIDAPVDGILLIPYTMEGELSVIRYANEKAVPVLTLDNSISASSQARTIGYVGANHETMGRQAGQLLLEALEKHFPDEETWNVLYLTGVTNSSGAVDRDKGILSVLETDSRVKIIAEYNAEFTQEKAQSIMEDCLLVYPELHGVICQNDLMAEGCCMALQEAERVGEIAVVGIDGQRTVVERIANGEMDGTVIQYPSMILDAAAQLEDYLQGNAPHSYNTFQETNPIDRSTARDYLDRGLPW